MPETPDNISMLNLLRNVLRDTNLDKLGSRPLARTLQTNVATTHRVVTALRKQDERLLPGHAGLLLFVEGLQRHVSQKSLDDLRAEVSKFGIERSVRMQQRKVRSRIDHRESVPQLPHDPQERFRIAAWKASASIAGLSFDDMVYIHALAPSTPSGAKVHTASCAIFAGVRSFENDVVIPTQLRVSVGAVASESVEVARLSKQPLLLDATPESVTFIDDATTPSAVGCSNLLVRSGTKGAHVAIVYASSQFPNPAKAAERFHIFLLTPRVGVRRIVMDMWIHKSMAPISIPEALCCWMQALVPLEPNALRQRRFPVPAVLRQDTIPLPQTSARTRELIARGTATVLKRVGLPRDEFQPFRMIVSHPLMGLSYATIIEF